MGNPEKETVDVPVSAIEDHNKSSSAELPTETTAIATESNSVPEQESSAPEATRPLQNPSAIAPSTAPPTYEDTQKEAVTMPASAMTSHQDPIEATCATQPTYPSYDEKVAMGNQVPPIDTSLTPLDKLDDTPRLINCPFCHQTAMTRVNKVSTSETSMAAVCCCLFGGIICAFLPYCMQMCHDAHHFCSQCGQKVAHAPHDAPVQVFLPENTGTVVVSPGLVQAPEAALKN